MCDDTQMRTPFDFQTDPSNAHVVHARENIYKSAKHTKINVK